MQCHRNFLDPSCVQVALYDNRLEVTSPGGLCYGLTLEDALGGHLKQRNRVIAEVFNQMGLIEAWGTGLQKICRLMKEEGLLAPEFIETANYFRINLYRRSIYVQSSPNIEKMPVDDGKNFSADFAEYSENTLVFGEEPVKYVKDALCYNEEPVKYVKDALCYNEEPVEYSKGAAKCGKDTAKFNESILQSSEGSVKHVESSGKSNKSSVKYVEGSVKSGKSSVKQEEGSGKSSKSSVKYVEGSVKSGKSSVKHGEKLEKHTEDSVNRSSNPVNGTKQKILQLIEGDNQISAARLAKRLSISVRAVEKNIRELREAKILVRHGAARGGYWEIVR